jgi:CIC family chloride channel protein
LARRRGRALDLETLKLFMRFVPSERQRVFLLTLALGVLCGLAAVAFHLAIQAAEHALIDRAMAAPGTSWIGWTIITPTLGGLLSGILLYYVVPDARGSGIPQVKVAYVVKGGQLPFRVAVGKFVLGVIQIGTGSSLGREGPTVQICAGIASLLGRAAALSRRNMRRLLPVGAAAGIAAAFNAPIAAVMFTIEEVVGDLDQTVLSGVVVAAAIAAVIERSVLGTHPVFDLPTGYGLHHASSLLFYALLGVAAALVSVLFTEALLGLRARFQRLTVAPPWARPAVGGLVTGTLAVMALAWLKTGGVTGAGYATLAAALTGRLTLRVLLALCAIKIAATVFSYSSGGAGGLFAPALFIGGMLGGAVGFLDARVLGHGTNELGAFALVGMGAVFAGIIRAPITSVLIIFEMTGGYALILPLMMANMTAYGVARLLRPLSVYEALLEQDGVQLPHGPGRLPHILEQVGVAEAMSREIQTLPADATVSAALATIAACSFTSYPVLDGDGSLVGLVSEARLRRTQAEGGGDQTIRRLVDRCPAITSAERLIDAALLMDHEETRQLAVVDQANGRVVGMLTMSDIVRAQARVARTLVTAHAAGPLSEVGETLAKQPAFRRLRSLGGDAGAAGEAQPQTLGYHLIQLDHDAPAVGQPVRSLDLPPGALLVTIEREGRTLVPHGGTMLATGDTLTLFATPAQLPAALAALLGPDAVKLAQQADPA